MGTCDFFPSESNSGASSKLIIKPPVWADTPYTPMDGIALRSQNHSIKLNNVSDWPVYQMHSIYQMHGSNAQVHQKAF